MEIRTAKNGTVLAVVDGTAHPVFTKGTNSAGDIKAGVDVLLKLVDQDAAIEAAKAALDAARNMPTPSPVVDTQPDTQPDVFSDNVGHDIISV